MNIDTQRIQAIERRMMRADDGPWEYTESEPKGDRVLVASFGRGRRVVGPLGRSSRPTQTGAFIAAAREDVPFLVETLRLLMAEIDTIKAAAVQAREGHKAEIAATRRMGARMSPIARREQADALAARVGRLEDVVARRG